MKVCIHRGAHQIGGTCIELESQGKRLVLDIGQPLDSPDSASVEMPQVKGLEAPDDSLLGIVLSHPHQDHYGLAFRVPKNVPFLMGAASERILAAAAVFTQSGGTFEKVIHLEDRKPLTLGPFTITPYLVDHSAYDSYAMLIEADGKRLFYTGDLRGHGRKSDLFERLVAHPPGNVDVLLMEGTTITRTGTEQGFPTESDLEAEMVKIFRSTVGMPLVNCSGQNIDRLVTVFRACLRSDRQLILDMYTAHILAATENPRLPQADWDRVRVYLPFSQKMRIIQDESFAISDKYKAYRIHWQQLAAAANRSVMLFRPSMRRDMEKANCLTGASFVYSMWDGYLDEEKMKPFLAWLGEHKIPLIKCHTSGHASVKDLQRLRETFASALVVPIHTQHPEQFAELFQNVDLKQDGVWWGVGSKSH
ncbi:MAG: MBL fold metallo-hydrolase [bacterium]